MIFHVGSDNGCVITKMLEEYNKDSVKIINNIKNIQL